MSVQMDESSDERRAFSPAFFDLHPPASRSLYTPDLPGLMVRLFSDEHLHFILGDHTLFHNFSLFINRYKPQYAPTLVRYLTMRKSAKAVEYANALARSVRFTDTNEHYRYSKTTAAIMDSRFEDASMKELEILRCEVLPAYVTMGLVDIVQDAIAKDIRGEMGMAREFLGELAEVFCLTDPSIKDNPIIYASEEFHRTTQYGTSFAINRNCRFLQGPGTDRKATARLCQAIVTGQESNETLLNFRRDGSPFINLLMCSPLYDDKGRVRYFIGAQIDVSHLVVEGRGIESFRQLLQTTDQTNVPVSVSTTPRLDAMPDKGILFNDNVHNLRRKPAESVNEPLEKEKEAGPILSELSQMFTAEEIDVLIKNSRVSTQYIGQQASEENASTAYGYGRSSAGLEGRTGGRTTTREKRGQPKRFIDPSPPEDGGRINLDELAMQVHVGRLDPGLPGVYQDYILARPHPSLRIIFVSPSMRTPGLLRTPLFSKVSGSTSTMQSLASAFEDGASVTCKVVWLPAGSAESTRRQRWMRATPLLGSDDDIGIWMCVFVPVRESDDNTRRSMTSASGIEFDFAKRERQDKGPREAGKRGQARPSARRSGTSRSRDSLTSQVSQASRDEFMTSRQSPIEQERTNPREELSSRRAARYAGSIPALSGRSRDRRFGTRSSERGESSRSQAARSGDPRVRQFSTRYQEMYLDRPEDDEREQMEEDVEMDSGLGIPQQQKVGFPQSKYEQWREAETHEGTEMAGVQDEYPWENDPIPNQVEHRRIGKLREEEEEEGANAPIGDMAVETVEQDV